MPLQKTGGGGPLGAAVPAEGCPTENQLLAFAEGQLRGAGRTAVERHVDGCADCAALLAEALRDDTGGSSPAVAAARDGDLPRARSDLSELATVVDAASRAPVDLRRAFADEPVQGLRIGRYLLLERIGHGAMGFVYTAHDPELARTVALKLIRPEFDGGTRRSAARARLIREAQAAARIEHPNLVTIYEVAQADDVAYIAMEYVKGQTVRAWLAAAGARPRPWRVTLGVFLQAGAGLAAAHRGGVLHRDFKPDNVLLDDDGRARVVDFGLAIGVHAEDAEAEADITTSARIASGSHLDLNMTATGSVLGTPAYMAPEQHAAARVDARADQYAFAVSLYEALHGVRPFAGKNLQLLWASKRADRIEAGGRAGVPGWLRAVVVRALASDPAARWPDMPAMLAALQADPTRRRVGVGAAATLGVALIAGLGWRARQHAATEAACVAEGQEIAALWTAERVAGMRAAFVATGLSFAADAWRRVEGHIDAWTAEYARARSQLCRAGELEHTVEPAVLARARTCFDDRRTALVDITRDWAAADVRLVTHAPGWAATFAPLTECTDFPALTRRLAIERAEGVAAADRARLRSGWQEARGLAHRGDNAGALAQAHALAEEAVALRSMSLASALSLTECDALQHLQRVAEAQTACERSFTQAVVGSDHEGAFHTAAALSSLASQRRQDLADAKLWLDLAEAHHTFIAAPAGQPDPTLARLLAARAYFFQDVREYDRALAEFRRAVAAYVQLQGEYSDNASYLWMSISYIAGQQGDLQTARAAVDQAGRIREAIFGANHPSSIEVDLARAELLHKLDPAHVDATYREILARAVQVSGEDSMLAASTDFYWASSLHERQGCAAARPKAERAAAILARDPDARPIWLPLAYLLTATCRLEAGDAASARAAAVLARDAFGEDPDPALAGPELVKARELIAACDAALARSPH